MFVVLPHGLVTELRMATGVLGQPVYWASAYYVDGLLIDSGPPRTAPELAGWLAGRPLQAVLNTHHHEDHVGGNPHLTAPALAPAAALARIARPPRVQGFRRLAWGQPRPARAAALPAAVHLAGRRVRALPAPGHSEDHTVLLVPDEGWLFTGDLFIHERARYAQADEDVLQTCTSIRGLLREDFSELYCGHAGLVADGKAALARKLQFLDEVRGRALELARAGLAPGAIARRLFGRLGRWHWLTGGFFSEINLIRQLLADAPA